MSKFKKFKAPQWFQELHQTAEEEKEDLFQYLSESIGYGPEWCKQNVKNCLQKLNSEDKNYTIKKLTKIDIMTNYLWSRFYYNHWEQVKDIIGRVTPEYNPKKKIIKFPQPDIIKRISQQFKKN
ncbi:MAG: hypothetical protein ACOC6D_08505 [Atribacterota bacterium]